MLTAAVILALIAYIKVVVVKKLIVEIQAWLASLLHRKHWFDRVFSLWEAACFSLGVLGNQDFYFE